MGKLVVTEFVTMDGVFQDPGGVGEFERGGWAFQFERGAEGNAFKFEELKAADAQLLGRVTYEGFAQAWPERNQDEFSQKMNSMPKYVVSSTLESAEWNNSHVISGDVAGEVAAIKERHAGDILLAGSGQLARGLLSDALVDELHLMVFPVVLGQGKRLFEGGTQASFELTAAHRHGQCVTLVYARA